MWKDCGTAKYLAASPRAQYLEKLDAGRCHCINSGEVWLYLGSKASAVAHEWSMQKDLEEDGPLEHDFERLLRALGPARLRDFEREEETDVSLHAMNTKRSII